MNSNIKLTLATLALPLALGACPGAFLAGSHTAYAAEMQGAADEPHSGNEEAFAMSAAQMREAGVTTSMVSRRVLAETLTVPGEVTANQYATTEITPRIEAQVLARHARLGDMVQKGQSLVTLSSVGMAEAQAALILAEREWQRTRRLGRDVVSEQRFIEAQVAAQQARAKLIAYGLADGQLKTLLSDAAAATGQFDLVAQQNGTVVGDDFVVGQFIQPGDILFTVSDEAHIWVEAQLPPEKAALVQRGAQARVLKDSHTMSGKVVQIHHTVDATTRTLAVRIEVDNGDDVLHAGEFVDIAIETGETAPVTAVPDAAVVLLGGERMVFKRMGNTFQPVPVEVAPSRNGWTEVKAGLAEGDEIVTGNAFLIKSLILKSKMGEGDEH